VDSGQYTNFDGTSADGFAVCRYRYRRIDWLFVVVGALAAQVMVRDSDRSGAYGREAADVADFFASVEAGLDLVRRRD
jgi:hypothetical protein